MLKHGDAGQIMRYFWDTYIERHMDRDTISVLTQRCSSQGVIESFDPRYDGKIRLGFSDQMSRNRFSAMNLPAMRLTVPTRRILNIAIVIDQEIGQ